MDIDLSYFVLILFLLFFLINRKRIYQFINSNPYKRGNTGCGQFLLLVVAGVSVIVVGGLSLYTFITTYPEEKHLREEVEKTKIEDIVSIVLAEATPSATFNLKDTSLVISDRSQIKIILNGIQTAIPGHTDRRDREWKVKLSVYYKNNTYKKFLVERIDRNGPTYICLLWDDNIKNKVYITKVTDIDFVLLLLKYKKKEEYN